MSQIATRNDVNSKCKGSMTSGVECPTKKEINTTALVGVKGIYEDNECVKIVDLIFKEGKTIHVYLTVNIPGGVNLQIFSISANTSVKHSDNLKDGFKTYDWYTSSISGTSDNNAQVNITIGYTGGRRNFTYRDNSNYTNDQVWNDYGFTHTFGNFNEWLNQVSEIYITIS